jgi:protein disulfide-isomerase A1
VRNEKEREKYVAEMRPLADRYKEYLHFVTIDADEYADAAEMLGIERGSGGLSLQNPNTGDIFPYRGELEINAEVVATFLQGIVDGTVTGLPPGATPSGRDEL